MKPSEQKRLGWLKGLAIFAILFGLLTIISGGRTLFNPEAQQAAGNYVPFVLWFNFLAGFVYVIAGASLWRLQRWAIWLSFVIAGATLVVFAAFGLYILTGGSYETRTIAAMILRTGVWLVISAVAYKTLTPQANI